MTPSRLRRIVKKYQRWRRLDTLMEAVDMFALELGCSSGALWHWMAAERRMRPMVQARIRDVAGRTSIA